MKTLSTRVFAVSLMICAGSASGQDADKPLLSGPAVNDSRPSLVEDNFGDMKTGKARLGAMDAIPAEDLRQILRLMGSPEADPAVSLSQEQNDRIRELMREFAQERRAFIQENRAEFDALRSAAGVGTDRGRPEAAERDMREPVGAERVRPQARPRAERGNELEGGPERRRAGGPDRAVDGAPRAVGRNAGEAKPTPKQEAARRELMEFMKAGPSTGDLQRRIYSELSPAQQQFIDDEVLLRAEERAQDRDMMMLERKRQDRAQQEPGARQDRGGQAEGQAGANRARIDWSKVYNEDGSVNIEALPERLQERLEKLDDQQRQRAVEALKKRFETGQRLRSRGED